MLAAIEPGQVTLTEAAAADLEDVPDGMALAPATNEQTGGSAALAGAVVLVPAETMIDHRLPPVSTSFVGRASQLAELKRLLREQQLVTLAGPPGSGKTRLAIELARRVLGAFADGVWFVALAPVNDVRLMPAAVANVLGVKEDAAVPPQQLVAQHLSERRLLLILDNFEHLAEAAEALPGWLAAAPGLRILVTSREVLRLPSEYEYAVPPLSLAPASDVRRALDSEAVRLFLERAPKALRGEGADAALADVALICERLDGLPLAVELAAARVKVLPPAAILDRLDHRLEILGHGARSVPARHRTLRAALDWSHGLLSVTEQLLLRRLSVFKGGWGLAAAQVVSELSSEAEVIQLTASLLDKSLVQRRLEANEPRYEMLETMREYGLERLEEAGELDRTRRLHALSLVGLAEEAQAHLTGNDQRRWLDRLEQEHDNVRAALRWALEQREGEICLRLAAALWRFWQIRGYIGEGRTWLSEAIDQAAEADTKLRAAALSAAGSLAYWQQDMVRACALYESALELRRERVEQRAKDDDGRVAAGDQLASADDQRALAGALYDFGWALTVPGAPTTDLHRGRVLGREALELFSAISDQAGVANATWLLAWNTHAAGDNQKALDQLRHCVELYRQLDDPFGLAWALHLLGTAALRLDLVQLAETSWHEALQIFAAAGDAPGTDTLLDDLANLAALRGHTVRALKLAATATRLGEASGSRMTQLVQKMEHRRLSGSGALSEAAMQAAWREGAAMAAAEAVAYALQATDADADVLEHHALRVYALGPMRVERNGVPIRRWGGEKAGSRQAQAIFAFLYDRGATGLTKDEVIELIWPDLPLGRGDLAFHRTLGGLRDTLESEWPGVSAIAYEGGRYRLSEAIVGWSDVQRFEELLNSATRLEGDDAIALLEEACRLYRGDLFDDCPFYGDSQFVESRRQYLHGRYVDALLALAELYEHAGDRFLASARFRQALVAEPASSKASSGIERVGATAGEGEEALEALTGPGASRSFGGSASSGRHL